MQTTNVQDTGKKRWIAPVILERASLGDAKTTKAFGVLEVVVGGLRFGPPS